MSLAISASLVGLLVGWLFVSYGLVLWSFDRYRDRPMTYAFAFTTTGFALMLVANRIIPQETVPSASLEVLGYLVLAAIGTSVFAVQLSRENAVPDPPSVRPPESRE